MAIVITGPLNTPTNLTLTAGTGGDATMVAGVYEVAVCAANTSSYSNNNTDTRRGPAAYAEITLTAGQKITVSYSAVTSATHYNIYVRLKTLSGSPFENWYSANRRVGSADLTATTTTTAFDITTRNNRRGAFDTFVYNTTYFQPPVSKDLGLIVAHVSGAHGAMYYDQLYDAVVAAGFGAYIAMVNGQFWFKGQIIIDNGCTGALAPYSWKRNTDLAANDEWHLWGGLLVNNAPTTFPITFGTAQRGAKFYWETWSMNLDGVGMDFTKATLFGGNFGVLSTQSYIGSGDHYIRIKDNTISADWALIRGINIQADAALLRGITTDGSILPRTANGYIKNCTFETLGQTTNITGDIYVENCLIGNTNFARHARPRNLVTGITYLIDCVLMNTATTMITGNRWEAMEDPEIYPESGAAGLANTYCRATRGNVTVVDEAGVNLAGATIMLENLTNSTTLINTTSDAQGQSPLTLIPYWFYNYDGSGVYGNGTGVNYGWTHWPRNAHNFRLTVSKDGYETYTSTFSFKKSGGFTPTITLKTASDTIITNKGVAIKLDKTNISGDRNVAVML